MSANVLDRDLFAAAVRAMPADSLSSLRNEAADQFASRGFPTPRDENWKYTNLSAAADITNAWLRERATGAPVEVQASPSDGSQSDALKRIDAHWLVIRNGAVDRSTLDRLRKRVGANLEISYLSEEPGRTDFAVDDPMSAFNAALLFDGLRIRVAANADVSKPLGILQVDDPSQKTSQVRVVIEMGENSRLQVIECALSAHSGAQFSNSVTEAKLAAAAKLGFVRIQRRGDDHVGVNRLVATLDRDASFSHNAFDFGGALTRNDIIVSICGKNADTRLRGLYLASGRQHIDNHTRVEHRVGPATSDEEYRGILNGRSRAVFNGQAVVFEGADGTDANQANHNLLLSDHAEIDTKPELEIYTDDVKCSHGATVGQLDESALFYLRSRGLDQEAARHLLTQAFAAGILNELAVEECRDYLVDALKEKLSAQLAANDDE
jgi:Fe-S cluster assembly protein SufD